MSRILVIGGAHIDRVGRLEGPHIPGASNPGSWELVPGGGGFNAARNLARLGHEVIMVSPRGGDMFGEMVSRAAVQSALDDRPITFLDRATPSYTSILEPDGNLVTALADMRLYDLMPARRLMSSRFRALLDAVDFVLTDANLPEEALTALAEAVAQRKIPLAGIAISPAKVIRFRAALPKMLALFMNVAEARALVGERSAHGSNWPDALRALGLAGGTVSAGGDPVVAFLPGTCAEPGTCAKIAPPPLPKLADVTGAGDALASGFIHAFLANEDIRQCLIAGIAAAQLTAGVDGPVFAGLSPDVLARARALVASGLKNCSKTPDDMP